MYKKLSIIIVLLLGYCFLTIAQSTTNISNIKLTYELCTNGLGFPEFEGGRTEFEFADINGDGHVDLLSIGDHGSPYINTDQHGIMVWFGDGTGNWTVHQEGNFGYGGIAVGDVNNDGFMDVGYSMHHNYSGVDLGDQLIEVALGDGTGMNWTAWDDGLATNGEEWGMFGTDFADINYDGYLDLGSVSFGASSGVHVYINQTDGSWTQSFGFTGGNSTMIFEFGEINRDGWVDFAVTQQYGTAYFGTGPNGQFELNDTNLPGTGSMGRFGVSLGDVDLDGGDDLGLINSDGGVEVWRWNDDNTQWENFSGGLPVNGDYEATQLFDMNVDGFMDICAFGDGQFTLWLGDGSGNWTMDAEFQTSTSGGNFKAFRVGGDVDHNGFPDIAIVAETGTWPSYQNHLYCYKESSDANSLSITAVEPFGFETYTSVAVISIQWLSAVPGNEASTVDLEISFNGLSGPWSIIAEEIPNNGYYQFQLPWILSSECYIRYTVSTATETAQSITPNPFTIFAYESIEESNISEIQSVVCYPVPSKSNIYVDLILSEGVDLSFDLASYNGKVISLIEQKFYSKGEHTVSLIKNKYSIPAGYQLLRITDEKGRSLTKKILFIE